MCCGSAWTVPEEEDENIKAREIVLIIFVVYIIFVFYVPTFDFDFFGCERRSREVW